VLLTTHTQQQLHILTATTTHCTHYNYYTRSPHFTDNMNSSQHSSIPIHICALDYNNTCQLGYNAAIPQQRTALSYTKQAAIVFDKRPHCHHTWMVQWHSTGGANLGKPAPVLNPNGILIGSAIFAHCMRVSPYTYIYNGPAFPLKIASSAI